ncbi:WhiB family transcriptional regulator [Rhodococcus kyotonensis]|nr:WhiB family transcriptional regulator [Rhodococcus kyotonensis]
MTSVQPLYPGFDDLTSWSESAACRSSAGEMFFPSGDEYSGASIEDAKRVCGRCPVTRECLRHAMLNGEQHGIWGGLTPSERRRTRLPRLTRRPIHSVRS